MIFSFEGRENLANFGFVYTHWDSLFGTKHKEGNAMRMSMAGTWMRLQEKFPDNVELVGVDDIVLPA